MRRLRLFLLLLTLGWYGAIYAQPANDLCANAEDIDCGETLSGTTIGATFDGVGTCSTSNTAAGVWYHFVGTGTVVTVSTCNQASYDTKISVFSGSCASLNCVDGADDASGCSGFTTELSIPTANGEDYYVLVHGFGSVTGNFSLSLTCADPPTGNDACAGAEPIACGETVSGSTATATFDGVALCGTSNTAPGVWYEFTGTGDVVTVTTCSPSTNYDTKLSVFTGSCGALSCVDGNDDDFTCSNSGLQSAVEFLSTPGETYYILVHGFGTSSGNFELSLSCMAPASNDAVCSAIPLTLDVVEGFNNVGATAQPGEPSPGVGTIGPAPTCDALDGWCSFEVEVQTSLWFTFTPDADGCYDIAVDGADFQAAVYTVGSCGDFGSYTEVAANDDGGPGLAPFIDRVELMAGETYYIQVDGFGTTTGEGTIVVTEAVCPPPPCTEEDATAFLVLTTDNFPGETTFEIRDSNGDVVQNTGFDIYPIATTLNIPLCLGADCYEFTIFDSFGDGICCGFGIGNWEIQDADGNTLVESPSDGNFGSSETVDIPQIFGLPCGWAAYDENIGCSGSAAYDEGTETFTVTSEDCEHQPYSPVNEEYAYANTYLCGDGEIIAYVEDLDGLGKAWAGIVMRESASPDSKKFQVMTGRDYLQHRVDWRTSTGGTSQSQTFTRFGQHWLRIVRTGPIFQAYTSSNGAIWGQPVATQVINMAECIELGLIVANVPYATSVTATFGNVWTSNDLMRPEAPTDTGGTVSDQLDAYPNPTSGLVTLNLRGYLEQGATLEVVNTFGQQLEQRRLGVIEAATEEVDLSRQPAGVYLIRLRLDDGTTEHVQVVRQ
ncbi:MAG: T9SS type A sorting domain-containing protein [Lewinella sp.]|nr:T9SS type A sorting domain-containing protein [Lewinella sp.]